MAKSAGPYLKQSLINAVYALLSVGEFGPITINMNNGTMVYLTTDNLRVLVDIMDPKCGSELVSRCLVRVANSKIRSKHLHTSAMMVTVTQRAPWFDIQRLSLS